MDELLAAYNDITASGLGPSQPQCDAAKAEQRSLAEPCAKFGCARRSSRLDLFRISHAFAERAA